MKPVHFKKDIYFKVEKSHTGYSIVACDKKGYKLPRGYILAIMHTGKVYRFSLVNPDIGICFDNIHRIHVQGQRDGDY